MTKKDLVGYYYTKITKSLKYLEFTFRRVQSMSTDPTQLAPEQLELWDSFAVRFARTSDLFLSKFIKAIVLKDDPAFDGGFRDFLNRAENSFRIFLAYIHAFLYRNILNPRAYFLNY